MHWVSIKTWTSAFKFKILLIFLSGRSLTLTPKPLIFVQVNVTLDGDLCEEKGLIFFFLVVQKLVVSKLLNTGLI